MYTIRPADCESAKFPHPAFCRRRPEAARVAMPFNLLSSRAPRPAAALQRVRSCLLAADASRSRFLFLPLRPPGPPRTRQHRVLTTKHGKVTIKLHPDWAPKTVAQFKALVKDKFYDGLKFHRVIPGFMAQTGDPTGTGGGGSKLPNVPAEFNQTHFKRGILGMARTRRSEFRQFAVLHHVRRRGLPRRQIYRLRRGHIGDGRRRQDQGGNRRATTARSTIPTRS